MELIPEGKRHLVEKRVEAARMSIPHTKETHIHLHTLPKMNEG